MTEAEIAMWRLLRHGFPDAHFRRQVPIGVHIADFATHKHKLVIEVDGGQHDERVDRNRTVALAKAGFRVIRFWNNDVLANTNGVAFLIDDALSSNSTPTPTLPPPGGGSFAEPHSWHV